MSEVQRSVEGPKLYQIHERLMGVPDRFWGVTGARSCDQREYSIDHNSKPEVEIDFVPTVFITSWTGLKYAVSNCRQVAPQVP